MPFKNYRDASRTNWGRDVDDGVALSREDLQFGCMLRIADATELMARNHATLVAQRDDAQRQRDYFAAESKGLQLQLRAARGQITKLKRAIERHEVSASVLP